MHRIAVACAALLVAVGSTSALADATAQSALARLFTSKQIEAAWFADSFLQQVPASQVQTIVGQLVAQLGAFKSVKPEGAKYRVNFEHGDDLASIVLDPSGRITGLFFEAPLRYAANFQSAFDAFKQLPGSVSVYVADNGAQRAALAADAQLAVGSTFKLAVLAAVQQAVATHATSWNAVVRLDARQKSLPSGVLQTWPDGALLTVYSYAALMISQSDNTAADVLLDLAGRSAVERYGPRNRPFLTTREAFVLKDPRNASLVKHYRASDTAQRRQLLSQIDLLPLPDASIFAGAPQDTDIEWFFTTRELCALMAGVQRLPLMSINPGVAEPADWTRVAYKGGSEPGVLNLTTWVVSKNRHSYCVSATWNDDKPVDELEFFGLYKSLLSTLKS
ncbi:MAG: serine hydrolase [Candidatus Eremiobacteraeota bacterium]|nr:serine hydrolase [Candidatus Eremiobacteraeota bacterium]